MATVTVDPNTSYQTFLGWQATAQSGHDFNATTDAEDEYPSTTYSNYEDALNAAMLDVGINSFRVEWNFKDVNTTGFATSGGVAIQPTTATSGQWHYDRFTRAMDTIVLPYTTLLNAQGEPDPYLILCLVDFRDAGYDAENDPDEYAFAVNKVIDHFFTTYGFLPDAIEPILEPDEGQNTTNWTAAKVANNMVAADALLVSNGFTGIRWIAPSTANGTIANTWYNDMQTANASALGLMDIVSYHRYTAPSGAQLNTLRDNAEADGNSTAMLEYISADIDDLGADLVEARNSLWQQFTVAFPWSGQSDDGSQYFIVNRTTWAVTLGERTKYLRHYFKYIRRGAVMKGVTNSSSSYTGIPFENANGKWVVPIRCVGSGDIDVVGLPAGTYGIRYTLGNGTSAPSSYDQALSNQTISAGQDVSFTMPGAGVVTVFDVDYMQPALLTNYILNIV